jgi:hypothetical protein
MAGTLSLFIREFCSYEAPKQARSQESGRVVLRKQLEISRFLIIRKASLLLSKTGH